MITRRSFTAILLGSGALLVSGCYKISPKRYRFRLTVNVDTPQGLRSGSSVYEVWANHLVPGSTKRIWEDKGEAVAVDLPGGQTLFALLRTNAYHGDMASLSMQTLDPAFNYDIVESAERLQKRQGITEKAEVPAPIYPMLVRFRDINDPASVEKVDPDNLAASFGTGYAIHSIVAEITDDPVTTGIGSRFVWWKKYRLERLRLNGKTGAISTNELVNNLGTGVFKAGD